MPFFALRAGQTTSPRPLLGILREAHEDLVAASEADQRTRAEAGAPQDDDALRPPAPWVDRPELADVVVAFRAVSHEQYLEAVLRVSEAYRGLSQADKEEGLKGMLAGSVALQAAMADFVQAAVATVGGLEDEQGPYTLGSERGLSLSDINAIKASGLLGDLYAAAKRYQELSASEKKHCGLRGQPISGSLSATAAQSSGDKSVAATVVQLGGREQSTSTTPAHDDILYVTAGSPQHSRYTILQEKAELGWAD
jgi:hypothetical protein